MNPTQRRRISILPGTIRPDNRLEPARNSEPYQRYAQIALEQVLNQPPISIEKGQQDVSPDQLYATLFLIVAELLSKITTFPIRNGQASRRAD